MSFHAIGHITRDRIRSGTDVREQPGGAAYYAALTLLRLGERVGVTTRMAAADRPALTRELEAAGAKLTVGECSATTTFDNRWRDAAMTRRAQAVAAIASPFTVEDLATVDASLLLLGPLLASDMDTHFIERAAAQGIVALDAQGMVREAREGFVKEAPWDDAAAGFKWVSFLKVDDAEAAALAGEADPVRAARRLAGQLGRHPHEAIVTLAERGAVIAGPHGLCHIAALPAEHPIDATGCGDTFFAAYLARRQRGDNVAAAGRFAAACATFTLERRGAFNASEREVLARLDAEPGVAVYLEG